MTTAIVRVWLYLPVLLRSSVKQAAASIQGGGSGREHRAGRAPGDRELPRRPGEGAVPDRPSGLLYRGSVFALKTLNADEYLDEGPFAATNRRWPYEDRI